MHELEQIVDNIAINNNFNLQFIEMYKLKYANNIYIHNNTNLQSIYLQKIDKIYFVHIKFNDNLRILNGKEYKSEEEVSDAVNKQVGK